MATTKLRFFATFEALYAWFEKHHASAEELHVGYKKRSTGEPSVSWPESVDAALAFGWIDGVRRSIDASSYTIRFTPRRSTSVWSKVNIDRVKALEARGLMRDAGRKAFEARADERTARYSYEQRKTAELDAGALARFRANDAAWAWFSAQAPWFRRASLHWVTSAKKEETRERRLATLIERSAEGQPINELRKRPGKA